jgi:hypothetical protein
VASCISDPLIGHGRHFGRTVHALCNIQALLTNSILRLATTHTGFPVFPPPLLLSTPTTWNESLCGNETGVISEGSACHKVPAFASHEQLEKVAFADPGPFRGIEFCKHVSCLVRRTLARRSSLNDGVTVWRS